jgi:voltage-gated potassium channel
LKTQKASYIILVAAALLYSIAVVLTIAAGVDFKTSAVWNLLSALYIYYSLIPSSVAGSPFVFVAALLDAFVFALLAVFLAGWFINLIRSVNLNERLSLSKIKKLRNHVIIVPYNNFARALADELRESKIKFVIIAERSEQAAKLYSKGMLAVAGSIKKKEVLELAGVRKASYVVACDDRDVENAMIAITSKDVNPEIKIISRVKDADNMKKIGDAGATFIVVPDITAGVSLGEEIVRRAA